MAQMADTSGLGDLGNASLSNVAEINVTPMIDVLLSLLIIFMVAAPPPPNEKHPITLPKDRVIEQPDTPEATLLVTIQADGQRFLGKNPLPAEFKAMVEALQANQKAQRDDRIAIRAEGTVKYRHVIEVMSAARAAGIASVGLASDRL